jgi:membrane dipeptidase
MKDPEPLHRDAVVIDMTCPLAKEPRYVDWWRQGGATAIAPTITGMTGDARSGFAMIGGRHRYVRERDDTLIVRRAGDILHARECGKLGLILHCQGTALIEDELELVDVLPPACLSFFLKRHQDGDYQVTMGDKIAVGAIESRGFSTRITGYAP